MKYALRNERYPIDNAEQIKTAESYFSDNLSKFSPSDRVEIACNLEKQASELNIELKSDWVYNYSRMMKKEASYSPEFEQNMKLRKDMCTVYDVKVNVNDKLVKAAELIDKLVIEKDKTEPLAMVTAIGELDKLANLEYHYDTRILDPVYTVFGCTSNPNYDLEKLACDVKSIKKASKNKPFMKKMSSLMGSGFATDFEKDPVELFKSLPAPEQQLLTEQISQLE